MQPITKSYKTPICSKQYITCIGKKSKLNMTFLYVLHAPGLALVKRKLVSVVLHDVVPQALLEWPPSLWKASSDDGSYM
jgi:hypothetical protein